MTNDSVSLLVQRYASGDFEHITVDAEIRFGDALFNNINSLNDLVPMLKSSFRTAQWCACYIVSETNLDTAGIFPHVVPLIHSEWPDVRGIACECYRWNATTAEHMAEAIKCLEDNDRAVRLQAVVTLRDFVMEWGKSGGQPLPTAIGLLRGEGKIELADALECLVLPAIPASQLKSENFKQANRASKFCRYIAAHRAGLTRENLIRFAQDLDEPDLTFLHRPYSA